MSLCDPLGLLLRLHPPLGLVPGPELQLPVLPVLEDPVLHVAEVLHDHLHAVGVHDAAVGQETLKDETML